MTAEKEFFHRHGREDDLPLASIIRELEPVFLENGWREPAGENPPILLMHNVANGDFVVSSALIREIRK